MRVLLVAYHFPPDAEVGGVRPYQIARHLPEFGIEPWVLTVDPRFAETPDLRFQPDGVPESRIIRTAVDETTYDRAKRAWRLLGRLRVGEQHGTPAPSTGPSEVSSRGAWAYHVLGYPDAMIGWRPQALRAADEVIRRVGFDAIVSTSPPRVATLVAEHLARLHRLPWIMDLRDPWWGHYRSSTSDEGRYRPVRWLQRRLFLRCVRRATRIVHNTEQLRQLTARIAPDVAPRTRTIPNGCDSAWRARSDGVLPTTFQIGHYGQIMGSRSPTAFLLGLRQWLDSRSPKPPDVSVRFVGTGFAEVDRRAQELGLRDTVELVPPLSRHEVPAQMAGDFVLLLLANAQPLQVPGKTYEYLAAGRRILAIADHDGATADLLRPLQGCLVAERPEEVGRALDRFHQELERGETAWVDRGALLDELQYSRRVEEFARLISEVVEARSGLKPVVGRRS